MYNNQAKYTARNKNGQYKFNKTQPRLPLGLTPVSDWLHATRYTLLFCSRQTQTSGDQRRVLKVDTTHDSLLHISGVVLVE